jgi:D-aminopeptidase
MTSPAAFTADGRPRARGLDISFPGDPGPLNAITDVPRVEVGVTTLVAGDDEFGRVTFLPWGRMDPLNAAVVHSVEEAVLNALVVNTDMVGRDGHRSPALPHDQLRALL